MTSTPHTGSGGLPAVARDVAVQLQDWAGRLTDAADLADTGEQTVALEFMADGRGVRKAWGPFPDGDAARQWSTDHLAGQPPYVVFCDDPTDRTT